MLVRIVDEKCESEVMLISVKQKCGSAVLLKLSIRSVNQKRGSKVLLRSVDQKCCSEKSITKSADIVRRVGYPNRTPPARRQIRRGFGGGSPTYRAAI